MEFGVILQSDHHLYFITLGCYAPLYYLESMANAQKWVSDVIVVVSVMIVFFVETLSSEVTIWQHLILFICQHSAK